MARALSFCFQFLFLGYASLFFEINETRGNTYILFVFLNSPPLSYKTTCHSTQCVLLAGGLHWLEQPQAAPDQFPVLENKKVRRPTFCSLWRRLTQFQTIQFRFQASHRSLKNFWENRQSPPQTTKNEVMDTISSVNIVQEEKYLFSILFLCVCHCVWHPRKWIWTLWEGVNDLLFSRTTPPI